jgi:hypothetical protein
MEIVKRVLRYVFIFISILFLTVVVILIVDWQQTSYLKLSNNLDSEINSYLIQNVNVIPMTQDTVLVNHTVYIQEGKISSIGEGFEIDNIKIIDGRNGFLMPGLVDMHVHVWDKQELGLYLANGITTIRNVWGMPMHLRMKKKISADKIFSPMFFTTGPKLTGPDYNGSDNLQLFSKKEAIEKVKSYKAKGYDFIKTYNGLPEDIFDAIIEQAKASEMDIVSHPSRKVPYSYHFNSQIITIEHAEDIVQQPLNYQFDTVKLNQLVDEFSLSTKTSFCPTLIVYYNIYNMIINDDILNSKEMEYMNPLVILFDSKGQFNRWDNAKKNDPAIEKKILDQHNFHLLAIKKMHDAGVNIVSGTDAGIGITLPGLSIHHELELYSNAGLSNYEVLKTATINSSKTHSLMSDIGSIEKHKIANLILLKNNPLEDLQALENPEIVFIKGRAIEKKVLNEFKTKSRNRNNLIATILRYLENRVVEK